MMRLDRGLLPLTLASFAALSSGCGSDNPDLSDTLWVEDQYVITESDCDERFTALIQRFVETEDELLYDRTTTFGGGTGDPPAPGTVGADQPFPATVDLPIDRALSFYINRRDWGDGRFKHDCDSESWGCSDADAGAWEARVLEGAFVNVGTTSEPCVVDVSGRYGGRLNRSPTTMSYRLDLESREGCDFAACEARVEARWTRAEQREEGRDCVLSIQCDSGVCLACDYCPGCDETGEDPPAAGLCDEGDAERSVCINDYTPPPTRLAPCNLLGGLSRGFENMAAGQTGFGTMELGACAQ